MRSPAAQGLDFVTFWAPALLVFLIGVPSREPWTAVLTGWENEAGFFLPAVVYTLLQVLTALTLRDFWLEDILPFRCALPATAVGPTVKRAAASRMAALLKCTPRPPACHSCALRALCLVCVRV